MSPQATTSPPVECICPTCGGRFAVRPSDYRRGRGIYCCRACWARRHGDAALLERAFWQHVKRGDGCWEWMAARSSTGYGAWYKAGRYIAAHRASYEIVHGPIPDGLSVCHSCDNRGCVNPAHLFLGTQAENMADRDAKDRGPRGSRNPYAKLTEADVRQIKILIRDGTTLTAIAKRFGVHICTISDIAHRRSWLHVT